MSITPETKDWTWVTTRACPDCGFDPQAITLANLPAAILKETALWSDVLAQHGIAKRTDPRVWSVLEYGAHVRDVLIVMHARVERMLAEDNPALPSWDQDQAAVDGRYESLNPALLVDEIAIEARMLANTYARVTPEQQGRPGRRSDGSEFTVLSLGQYLLHDLHHHAWDVRKPAAN